MLKLVFRQLRAHFRRTLAVVVAIVLGVAFFTASMMSGSVITEAIRGEVGNQLRGSDLIVLSETSGIDPALVDRISGIEGVRATESVMTEYGFAAKGGASTVLRFGQVSTLPEIRERMPMKAGRLPTGLDEIALTEGAATSLGVGLDDVVSWNPFSARGTEPATFTVVGIVSGGNAFGTNLTEAFITPQAFDTLAPDASLDAIVVQIVPGAFMDDVQSRVGGILRGDIAVMTFDQLVDAEVASMEQGSNALTYGLAAFALIALFVAGIVIANTFSITLTQRTHELAMLRCLGAEARQIRRSVILEALALGMAASVLGIAAGYGIVSGGAALLLESSLVLTPEDISLSAVVAPFVIGTAVTVLSAIVPARHATAVHPLRALRRSDAPIEDSSMGILRATAAMLLIAGGGILLIGGMFWSLSMEDEAPTGPLLVGMAGGALSFIGLLVASSLVVPIGLRGVGAVVSMVLGVPARIASSNAMRNPRRTAATSAALMMGVTLITMMTVGAATVQATWNDVIDQHAPIDLVVGTSTNGDETEMAPGIFDGLAGVDGVRTAVPVHARTVFMPSDGEDIEITAKAIAPHDGRAASRSAEIFDFFDDGTVLVPLSMAESYGLSDGSGLTLAYEVRVLELSVRTVQLPDWEVYVTSGDMERLAPETPVTGAWLRLEDDADVKEVVRTISDSIPEGESVSIHGGASDRATYLELVDQMLLITTGLLGVAVVIAIVGVGNTLTLSVLERTRESGMLRAMGLTAAQLRGTLAIEGVMISFVGGLIGLVAGSIYGWLGAITLFGSNWTVTPGFPGTRLLLILIVAMVAGILASVLPGRRATAISPVEALATV